MGADAIAMRVQKVVAVVLGGRTRRSHRGIAQHVADRHPGRLQTAEKLDPDQGRGVVVAPAAAIAVGIGQQPDPFVIPDRVGRNPGSSCQFSDLHSARFRQDAHRSTSLSAL